MNRPMQTVDAVFDRVDIQENGCWNWNRCVSDTGYGSIRLGGSKNGKAVNTHRAAWIAYHGPVPDGMFVCHRCDNRRCCNPDHLFLGTHTDNMRDMIRKGRKRCGDRRGEGSGCNKLTWAQVAEIRKIQGKKQREIGEMYGVNQQTISRVLSGVCWKLTRV